MNTCFDSVAFLKNLTEQPGVYLMHDQKGKVIYVGKAKNLKKRVSSYFNRGALDTKTLQLVSRIAYIEITVTHTENEALLLENNLIKLHHPRYNIVLRDDKSYPYVFISNHEYPRIAFMRGKHHTQKGHYFGPYPSSSAVRDTLLLLQKIFKIRPCEDSFFAHRNRPCLQYQIHRCAAPCVHYIDPKNYAENVTLATLFLEGKNQEVFAELAKRMEAAAEALQFETAAMLRDEIQQLQKIQEQQNIFIEAKSADVFGVAQEGELISVYRLMIRRQQVLGGKSFFFESIPDQNWLHSFLSQLYFNETADLPKLIITDSPIDDRDLLAQVLFESKERSVRFISHPRTSLKQLLDMANKNAKTALTAHILRQQGFAHRFDALQTLLGLSELNRIECFDISHTRGEATVASCVVFTREGPAKREYRQFNITDITPGDDYAAMLQAVSRRYKRRLAEESVLPDLLLIDGGKGQVTQAKKALHSLSISLPLLGVAKGTGRRVGLEELVLEEGEKLHRLLPDSPEMQLIVSVRDEAHRFAIKAHRKKRGKERVTSRLSDIPGVGMKKRQALMQRFGSVKAIKEATILELTKVTGISESLARRILETLTS